MDILIISSSVRMGRNSHRVALFFEKFISQQKDVKAEILDLDVYQFPIFDERLRNMQNPTAEMIEYAYKVKHADGILIVTPEYNGGYPASLKNAIDLLYVEWKRKPVALASVSTGNFGAAQVLTSLSFSMWKIGVLLVPAIFQVAKVEENYNEKGVPKDKEGTEKAAAHFVNELTWCVKAVMGMNELSEDTLIGAK